MDVGNSEAGSAGERKYEIYSQEGEVHGGGMPIGSRELG